jgi:hypothetical protein
MFSVIFLTGYFIYLHFKYYPLPGRSFLWKLPILSPHPLPLWGCFPTHTPISASLPFHSPTLGHRTLSNLRAAPPQPPPPPALMSNKALFCHVCNWSHGSLHVYSLVGGPVLASSGWTDLLTLLLPDGAANPLSNGRYAWNYRALHIRKQSISLTLELSPHSRRVMLLRSLTPLPYTMGKLRNQLQQTREPCQG